MELITDPPIPVKIRRMKERVRWQHPLIAQRGIDQTRFVLDDGGQECSDFSFLAIGDSGWSTAHKPFPQRKIAELMVQQREGCRFVLHTGDVIYQVGSKEYYPANFIEPYREFLLGGERPQSIPYDRMVFSLPVFPALGNHDYYDLSGFLGALVQATRPLRTLLGLPAELNLGWHGSHCGDAFARAFLDYLKAMDSEAVLAQHLDRYYTATTETGRCLRYQPGHFTRLPNRYYTFRYGGIDFFALDSSTFNTPIPLPSTREGERHRQLLAERRQWVEQQKQEIFEMAACLSDRQPEDAEQLEDLHARLEQLDEIQMDIDKQLIAGDVADIDVEQLAWLRQRLIDSWHTPEVRGRVVFFHHPPYVTEASKWYQAQTLAVRQHLRQVLDEVAAVVGTQTQGRPLVDLVMNGHAHCLEYLRTVDTGRGDAGINWIVCGGSGAGLRRQRSEGAELMEAFPKPHGAADSQNRLVARSHLFVGRDSDKSDKHRPYTFVRIDVGAGNPARFTVRPFVAEQHHHEWSDRALEPFELPRPTLVSSV